MPLNLAPLLRTLTIKTKTLDMIPLDVDSGEFSWSQRPFVTEIERQYNAGLPVRVLVLKARQLGISTATEGILYLWGFIHHGINGLVMTHRTSQSSELFQMTQTYWDTWPFRDFYSLKYATKQTLNWQETRSRLSIGTARAKDSGRGGTYHAVHLSEVAFFPDPEELFTSFNATVPDRHGSIMVVESTANGVGNWFYDKWQECEEGSGEFVGMFFPWWKHGEYRNATSLSSRLELTADERQLLQLGATYEHIAWRRRTMPKYHDIKAFMQEYPATPEEAFIVSGTQVFDPLLLREVYKKEAGYRGRLVEDHRGKVTFQKDPSGSLTVFRAPTSRDRRSDRYFIGSDPSRTVDGDPVCAQVINRQTLEQVAVFSAQATGREFARHLMLLGKYYHDAMIATEIEGGGQTVIATLIAWNYPNIWLDKKPDRYVNSNRITVGWSTSYNRKRWVIGLLQSVIKDRSLTLHDASTYHQFLNFVEDEYNRYGNSMNSDHDDAVMALGIAVTASDIEGPFMPDRKSTPVLDLYTQQEWESD